MRRSKHAIVKWMTPGLHIKRWLALFMFGITVLAIGLAQAIVTLYRSSDLPDAIYIITLSFLPNWMRVLFSIACGVVAIGLALYELNRNVLVPFMIGRQDSLIDVVYAHHRRQRGLKLVAIGGGTGLPSVLRAMKTFTGNITAVVTVADDGGSSGKLRRELGVLPPGDLRNNIAALANDEDLMTHLFQYRFAEGGLEGHSFGNLFLTAMANITGSMDKAVAETGRVLAIEGRVLPSTLEDTVTLIAEVRIPGEPRMRRISGESQITDSGGKIERVFLHPDQVRAYPEAIRAILNADLIVIGPGSLFTSILPNLLVNGITEAIRANSGCKIYVCNVATQHGETDGYSVADHVLAIENHIGRGVFHAVLANNSYPSQNAGERTHYVLPVSDAHPIYQRYKVHMADLTDAERPWRHDPTKLAQELLGLYNEAAQAVPYQLNAAVAS